MKFRNLIILVLALAAAWIVGCSKDSNSPAEAVDPVQQTASNDEFTQNVEDTFNDGGEESMNVNYNDNTFQKTFAFDRTMTYDTIFKWGRIINGWRRTVTDSLTSDTTATVLIDFTQTSATFRVRGIIGVDTVVTNKPFTHPMQRKAKAVRGLFGWRLDEITGAYGRSTGNTDMDIDQVEIVPVSNIPSSTTITITDPPNYYMKVGAIRRLVNQQVPVVNPGDSVKVTVWVTNAQSNDVIVLHYGVFFHNDGKFRRARKVFVPDPARDAEVPGTLAFTQSYKVHRLPPYPRFQFGGKFHAAIDVLTHGTIYEEDINLNPYKSVAYAIPYYVIP